MDLQEVVQRKEHEQDSERDRLARGARRGECSSAASPAASIAIVAAQDQTLCSAFAWSSPMRSSSATWLIDVADEQRGAAEQREAPPEREHAVGALSLPITDVEPGIARMSSCQSSRCATSVPLFCGSVSHCCAGAGSTEGSGYIVTVHRFSRARV
jgi:hypothetical protein